MSKLLRAPRTVALTCTTSLMLCTPAIAEAQIGSLEQMLSTFTGSLSTRTLGGATVADSPTVKPRQPKITPFTANTPATSEGVTLTSPPGLSLPMGTPSSQSTPQAQPTTAANGGVITRTTVSNIVFESIDFPNLNIDIDQPINGNSHRAKESIVFALNTLRKRAGLLPLVETPALDTLAQDLSADMLSAQQPYLDPSVNQQLVTNAPAGLRSLGTTAQKNYRGTTAASIVNLWESHPANKPVLEKLQFNRVGIGVAADPSSQVLYITAIFGWYP